MSDTFDHAYSRLAVEEEDQHASNPNLETPASDPLQSTPAKENPLSTIPLRTDDGVSIEVGETDFPDLIRLVEIGKPRRALNVDFSWTVREFKERFFAAELERRASIRLIYQGRMINDDSATLRSFNIVQNGFVHVVISQSKGEQSRPDFVQPNTQSGCTHEEFDNGILSDEQLARQLQRRDRDDVFLSVRGGRNNDAQNEQRNNPSEFACGFITGLLLGIWAFLFLLSPRWRQSRRFRYGVILGLLCNMVGTVLQRSNGH